MKRQSFYDITLQVVAVLCAIAMLAPILYAVSVSFMQPREILTSEYHLLPTVPTLENYIQAFTATPLLRYFLNSFIVALVCSAARVAIGTCSAFAFSFYEFPGKRLLFMLTLVTMMIPADVLIVQNFVTVSNLGLVNTYLGICSVFLVSANNIFLIRQQFLTFSKSLQEAAMLDGASDMVFMTRILLPTSRPILFTVFLSSFVNMWNQYVWPMMVTNQTEMRTIQVGITMLKDRESSAFGPVMAGSVIALLPTVILFIVFLKQIVSGMMSGAVKE